MIKPTWNGTVITYTLLYYRTLSRTFGTTIEWAFQCWQMASFIKKRRKHVVVVLYRAEITWLSRAQKSILLDVVRLVIFCALHKFMKDTSSPSHVPWLVLFSVFFFFFRSKYHNHCFMLNLRLCYDDVFAYPTNCDVIYDNEFIEAVQDIF